MVKGVRDPKQPAQGWGTFGQSDYVKSASTSVDLLSSEQTTALLGRLKLPLPQLAQSLVFHNQPIPKLGIVKPIAMLRLSQPLPNSTTMNYDLAQAMMSIFSLIMQAPDAYVQVISMGAGARV